MSVLNRQAGSAAARCAIVAVPLVTLLVFLPSLGGEFVYDSVGQVALGSFVHTPSNLWSVLSLRVLGMDVMDGNRPICLLSLMLDSLLWGREAFGFRLTNVVLHALNATLLCATMLTLIRRGAAAGRHGIAAGPWIAALLALGFALHPLVIEAVYVVSFREDLLATAFVLASLVVLDTSVERLRPIRLLIILALLQLLALGSKESGIALAPVVVVYWLTVAPPESRRLALAIGGVCGAAVALFLAVRFALEPEMRPHATPPRLGSTPLEWFRIQANVWTFQAWTLVDPRLLSAWHPVGPVCDRMTRLGTATVGVVALLLAWAAWRLSYCRVGLVLLVAAMLPVANIVAIQVPIADRFLYLPLAGVAMAIAGMLASLEAERPPVRRLGFAVAGMLLMLLPLMAYANVRRQFVFYSDVSLWQDAVRKYPESKKIRRSLAKRSVEAGEYDQAERLLEPLVADRSVATDHYLLAIINFEKGKREEARGHFAQTIEMSKGQTRFSHPNSHRARLWGQLLEEFEIKENGEPVTGAPSSPRAGG